MNQCLRHVEDSKECNHFIENNEVLQVGIMGKFPALVSLQNKGQNVTKPG